MELLIKVRDVLEANKWVRHGEWTAKEILILNTHRFITAKSVVYLINLSEEDFINKKNKWLKRFPMWDWVGGRTSVMSAVGLLPAALQGLDIDAMLEGAAEMDHLTRSKTTSDNPAALLALMWHHQTKGKGGMRHQAQKCVRCNSTTPAEFEQEERYGNSGIGNCPSRSKPSSSRA